jgi:hypothetical protein
VIAYGIDSNTRQGGLGTAWMNGEIPLGRVARHDHGLACFLAVVYNHPPAARYARETT